jgi:hypothetical protein
MNSGDNIDFVAKLARRAGTPAKPAVNEFVSEVRSDSIFNVPERRRNDLGYTLGSMVIEWGFRLPLSKVAEFQAFLNDNEKFIADCCEKLMEGVHYRGTYMAINGLRAVYRTYWAYDTPKAVDAWNTALEDKSSTFYSLMTELRSFWALDPEGTAGHWSPAITCVENSENRLFGLTLAAAKHLADRNQVV